MLVVCPLQGTPWLRPTARKPRSLGTLLQLVEQQQRLMLIGRRNQLARLEEEQRDAHKDTIWLEYVMVAIEEIRVKCVWDWLGSSNSMYWAGVKVSLSGV